MVHRLSQQLGKRGPVRNLIMTFIVSSGLSEQACRPPCQLRANWEQKSWRWGCGEACLGHGTQDGGSELREGSGLVIAGLSDSNLGSSPVWREVGGGS